ncbi:CspA family cold shock protein [Nocardiopsis mwathae]|uniref:CspA family cold shock protein n=1 Tax=Nocardiopsis mwathae TaxID=1472723 RepID=A0A7X0D7K3_9ACTN|nr:cold-shock protein [Nocardiopsis mwathae]MBB6173104.1 CspA family cold shock protein [Nocardiopsis mwathae]
MEGTVKEFSAEDGYGFITPDEGDEDVFVHFSGIRFPQSGILADGQRVEFDLVEGERGPHAQRVRAL